MTEPRAANAPTFHRLDEAEQERAGAQKKAAESQFRAAFLRQLLEPLTRELISTSEPGGGVGSGMETYRYFLEEALAGHLERQWPLPELDLDPGGSMAREAADVERAGASYALSSGTRPIAGLPGLAPISNRMSTSPSNAARLDPADPTAGHAPRLPRAQRTEPGQLSRYIESAAQAAALPDSLLRAVVEVESGGRSDAVSPAGAQGLMQLMPATAAELGVTNPFDPKQNLEGGAEYLAEQLDRFDGDIRLALAAYNAGPGAVKRHGGVPPYPETERYIESVLQWKAHFEVGTAAEVTP